MRFVEEIEVFEVEFWLDFLKGNFRKTRLNLLTQYTPLLLTKPKNYQII